MPVEERLRNGLADLADQVRVEAERPLADVRLRRQRRVTTLWAAASAAVVVLVVGVLTSAPQPTPRPEPSGPPTGELTDATPRTIPFATYVRTITDDDVLDAGVPREQVADLFGGGDEARAELVFRNKTWESEQEGWALWFVDAQGRRRIGERGSYYPTGATSYQHDGELALVGQEGGFVEIGFNYVFSWELEGDSLVFEPIPKDTRRPTAVLLDDGTWERQGN